MDLRKFVHHSDRRESLAKELTLSLSDIGSVCIDNSEQIHCENLIGCVTVPLGVAGPLILKDSYKKNIFIPLATTEGALVASVNRGCKIIGENNGVCVEIENLGATRGPVFQTSGIREGKKISVWIQQHFLMLQQEAASTSSYLSLLNIDTQINGTELYLRLSFDTSEAMGMNMVTIATDKLVHLLEKECNISCIAVAGNFDIDKKPAWLNSIKGRGKCGWAELIATRESVERILKTTPEKIVEVVRSKCWAGSMLSGAVGFNAHFANMLLAFYLATGQDAANIVEGSQGMVHAELTDQNDLYFSVTLPNIIVGTIGNGKHHDFVKDNLNKLGCLIDSKPGSNAKRLARLVAATVWCGEISLLAAQTNPGELMRSHFAMERGDSIHV